MGSKSIIVVGVLTCASLQVHAGLFDKVSDLTGGIIKIEENNSDDAQTAPHEAVSREAKKYSKKMSGKEYIAERDAFIERVKENWGTSASAFNIENKDFAQIRELYPEEAGSLAERAARLRGSVFSNLKYTSDKKEGIKLLKKLASDETELRTIFDGLKVKTMQRQAAIVEAQRVERKARELAEKQRQAEIAKAQKAEREARELAEKQRQAEIAKAQKAEREDREFAETRVLNVRSNADQSVIVNRHGDISVNDERLDSPKGDVVYVKELPQGQKVIEVYADKPMSQNVDWRIILISLSTLLLVLLMGVLIALLTKKPSRQEMPKGIRACYFMNRWDCAFVFLSMIVVLALPFCLVRAKVDSVVTDSILRLSGFMALSINVWILSKANVSWGDAVLMLPFRAIMGMLGPLLPVASVIMTLAGISAVNEGTKRIGTAKDRIHKNQGWMTRQDESDIRSGRDSVSSGIATAILGAIFGWISKKLWEAINSRTRSLVGWESWD